MLAMVLTALLTAAPPASPSPPGPGDIALQITADLVAGDADALAELTPAGFSFDGRQVWSKDDIRAEWLRALERRPLAGDPIYGVEELSYEDMVKQHGKPPARLAGFNFTGSQLAIINLGGRAIVFVFKKKGDAWTPVAVSD